MSLELFLREHRDEILAEWRAEAGVIAASLGRSAPALADALPRLIGDFARIFAGESELVESVANDCCAELLGDTTPLSQLVQELGLFRRCVLRSWRKANPTGLHVDASQTAAHMDAVVERTVDRYIAMRTSLLDAFERIALSALTSPDLDGFLHELLTIFTSFAPSVEALAVLLREGDRLTLRASIGPLPPAAAGLAMPLEADLAIPGGYGVRLFDEGEVVGLALAMSSASTDIPVVEKRLFALVAQRAATAIVKHRLRADATKRTAQLDAFIQAIPSPIYLGTSDGFSNANRAGLDLAGVATTTELKRLGVAEVVARIALCAATGTSVTPDDSPFSRALRGEHVATDCWARSSQDADPRLYRCSAGPVIVDGELDGAVLVMSDITELKRAEDRFRTMFERIPMAIAQSDPATGTIVRTNAKMCELTGLSMEELVGHSFLDWTHPEDRGDNREKYRQLVLGELDVLTTEKRYVRKDGRIIWVRVTSSLLPSPGEPRRTLATIEDITARRTAELEREQLMAREGMERAWLQAVLDQMPEAVVLLDVQGHVTTQNQAAQALSNSDATPLVDLRLHDGPPIAPADIPGVRALAMGDAVRDVELVARRSDGTRVPVLVSAAPVRGPDGTLAGATMVLRDITALKEIERLREEWSAIVAHDLQQPVNAILLGADLVLRDQLGTRARTTVERIRGSTRRLSRMIDDLKQISALETQRLALNKTSIDLVAFLRDVVARCAEVTSRVVIRAPLEPVLVSCDPGRVEQVLANLLSNAGKYGNEDAEIGLALEVDGADARISVTNTGAGIPPDEIETLFDRYVRARSARRSPIPGSGLGLYIAKGLVEAHGGRIWATSSLGATTTFHLTLPLEATAYVRRSVATSS